VPEVAVIGVPDAVYGERLAACIVPRPGCRIGVPDLAEFLAARQVARHKQPELVELFADLPRNAGGKLAKVELREEVGRRVAGRA
jgi:acyl-CoA synthetase